jgi:hypothetical protein
MGGSGSRRQWRHQRRRQVEWAWILDADAIPRPVRAATEGDLEITWRAGPQSFEVPYLIRADGDGLELDVWMPTGVDWLGGGFRLDSGAQPFGGMRTYLRCPGLVGKPCGARALKLYWPIEGGSGFACRDCHQLAYRSSQERPFSLAKIRRRVEGPKEVFPSPAAVDRRFERQRTQLTARLVAAGDRSAPPPSATASPWD